MKPQSSSLITGAAPSRRFLLLVVFLAGVGTLGIEMVASRLLAPFFGTSQPIWAVVIGLTLIYLSIGYHWGGKLADRQPEPATLFRVICWGGFLAGFIPLLSDPILRFSQQALIGFQVGGFLGALIGVLLLFAAPVILLAMVSPIALRIAMQSAEVGQVGSTAGSISAISTVGSIVGTFLTALVLIPAIGTARTTYLFAGLLLLVGLLGLRQRRYWLMALILLLVAALTLSTRATIKAAACTECSLIFEQESAQNYIQVAMRESGRGPTVNLLLNEGLAIHSVYNPRYQLTNNPSDLLTNGGPWDYFQVAPYFYPNRTYQSVQRMLMLGSATGTAPKQFLAIYGADKLVDAVEIDPAIIQVGRDYFAMDDAAVSDQHPHYHVHAEDARYWLAKPNSQRYDIVALDAYHQPYIPFHLTTVEFFQLIQQRLAADGVVVVNAGKSPSGDDRLGQAIGATMLQVFPRVYVIEAATDGNQLLVGLNQPIDDGVRNFIENYQQMEHATLRQVMDWTLRLGEFPPRLLRLRDPQPTIFTDDHAPVEQLIDGLIVSEALR